MKLIEFADREMMMMDLANVLAGELARMLMHAERASIAVPGGATPAPIFDTLSAADLDWSRVDVLLTDERWVPEDHRRSNTRLLRRHLLVNRAAAARLIPLYGGTEVPEESVATLADGVRAALPLSVVLLGMGVDMHTASLFAGADKLEAALSPKAPPLLTMRPREANNPRVTLTAPVINGAMSKHLVITGADKKAALEQAQKERDVLKAPVKAILSDTTVYWAP